MENNQTEAWKRAYTAYIKDLEEYLNYNWYLWYLPKCHFMIYADLYERFEKESNHDVHKTR